MTIRQLRIRQSNKYPFCLDTCAEAAQDFRWRELRGGGYSILLDGKLIHMWQNDDCIEYESDCDADLTDLLRSYFRMDDDIDTIYGTLSLCDERMAELICKYPSTRIMRQPDPWECMVAFLCSRRVSPPRIAERVERMAQKLGDKVELNGEVRYTFPTPEKVCKRGEGRLEALKLGFRDVPSYIIAAAERICDGKLGLHKLAQPEVSYGEARLRLTDCDGIGGKIADCIALFSLDKMNAFPLDSRVERTVRELYFPWLKKQLDESIVIWAQERFGPYAGYANQFLYTSSWGNSPPLL